MIKPIVKVKVRYNYFEFDEIEKAINYAKASIQYGEDVGCDDVEVTITFVEESEEKENE